MRILLMFMRSLLLAACAVGAVRAESDSTAGVLSCEAIEGTRVNLLVRSSVDIVCTFELADGSKEVYRGENGIAFGLDLSFRHNEQFAFSVLSTSPVEAGTHRLSGRYTGVSASAAAGVGLGAASLVGGSSDSFGLQPLALEINQGFGLAGGIGYLYLEPM